MSDQSFQAQATGAGAMEFLDWAIEKGRLKKSTGQSMKTAVKEVLSSTEGEESWEGVDLDSLDVEDAVERFETLRAMKFSPGSLNTYKARFKKSLAMFEDFRADPGSWKPTVKPRAQSSKGSASQATRSGSAGSGQAATPPAAPTRPAAHRPTTITYPFPIRDGMLAAIEIPADLTRREAARLTAFIQSLAIDEEAEDREDKGR